MSEVLLYPRPFRRHFRSEPAVLTRKREADCFWACSGYQREAAWPPRRVTQPLEGTNV